jgi:TonB family protein
MKALYLTIITLLFFVKAHSQDVVKADPTVEALRIHLAKNIHPSAIALENGVQGRVIITFKIDDNKKISDINIAESLTKECDAEVLRVIKGYTKAVLLPNGVYTIGVQFLIKNRKKSGGDIPLDKSLYQNFLFDISVITIF